MVERSTVVHAARPRLPDTTSGPFGGLDHPIVTSRWFQFPRAQLSICTVSVILTVPRAEDQGSENHASDGAQ